MATILGLSGSLRKASFNTGLLRAAAEITPQGTTLTIGDIHQVPLYNADEESAHGLPPAVQLLQEQLKTADGLLLVSPEYNNSVPGVFKNVIDWMSRGPGAKLFAGKPVAVIGASPGGFGTILSQNAWLPVLRTLKTRPWHEGRLMVSGAADLFDAKGTLTDAATRDKLSAFVAGFAQFVAQGGR